MLLLIDNYDSFTWNLVQRFGELDAEIDLRVVRNDRITPEEVEALAPSHIVVSPGPCSPNEAGVSNAIIQKFAGRIPVLGVCLGHQCIGHTHGMTVTRHRRIVHGKTSPIHHDGRGLFAGVPSPFTATRYHSLVVLPETVPAPVDGEVGFEVSAWTFDTLDDGSTLKVVMGLRRAPGAGGTRRAPLEGVQFHPESFLTVEGPKLLANFLAMA
jgi:anthranilate synthase/aminodeoxychorismate synthase-like glutamine amidotransferase